MKNLYKYSKIYSGSDPLIVETEVFRVEVLATQEDDETTQEVEKTTQETEKLSTKERVLEELEKNGTLTRDELASILGVSANAIKQHLANLTKEGRLTRVGSTKAGHWKVLRSQKPITKK